MREVRTRGRQNREGARARSGKRGRLVATAAVAAAGMLSSTAGASHGGSGGQQRDFVAGVSPNEVALGQAHSGFSAHSDPLGTNPNGHVTTRGDPDGAGPIEPFKAEGPITCLRVEGNRATFKWRFTHAEGSLAPFEGGGIQAFLEDNSDPRNGTPVDRTVVDLPQPEGVFDLTATQCDDPNSRANYDPINSGNFVVHDAEPSPSGVDGPLSSGDEEGAQGLPEVEEDEGKRLPDADEDEGGPLPEVQVELPLRAP
jgi:hypothetical protein